MGDDLWNPIIAETYIKREPWWSVTTKFVIDALLIIVGVWLLAIVILSIEKGIV